MRAVKVLALALLIAAVAAKPPTGPELAHYTFEQFVADFRRDYKTGSDEYADRRKIFEAKNQTRKALIKVLSSPPHAVL